MSGPPPPNNGRGLPDPRLSSPGPFNPDLPQGDAQYMRYLEEMAASGNLPTYIPSISAQHFLPAPSSVNHPPAGLSTAVNPNTGPTGNSQLRVERAAQGTDTDPGAATAPSMLQRPSGSTRRQPRQEPAYAYPGMSSFRDTDTPDSPGSSEGFMDACQCPGRDTMQKPKRHWRKSCRYNPDRDGRERCDICGEQITNRQDNLVRHKRDKHGIIVVE